MIKLTLYVGNHDFSLTSWLENNAHLKGEGYIKLFMCDGIGWETDYLGMVLVDLFIKWYSQFFIYFNEFYTVKGQIEAGLMFQSLCW